MDGESKHNYYIVSQLSVYFDEEGEVGGVVVVVVVAVLVKQAKLPSRPPRKWDRLC